MADHQPDDLVASAAYWDRANLAAVEDVKYWLAVPLVRRAVNLRMTGEPEKLFIQSFLDSLRPRWPIGRALSVGCGAGELERGVAGQGATVRMDGIDVGAGSLAQARRLAEKSGLGAAISYHQSDAVSFLEAALREKRRYDLVFFHGSLHHVRDLEQVLDLTAAVLRGGDPGLLYLDEYVGPSRDEWTAGTLGYAAGLFDRVAARHRRIPEMRPPIAIADPTEMIRSSAILPLLEERFETVTESPYYGNVLSPLVCAIRGSSLETPEIQDLLRQALELEDFLVERRLVSPLYVALTAQPR
jgi:SAM-dependent methyltransferase